MFIPTEWTVIAKRVPHGLSGWYVWAPCWQYSLKDIEKIYDMAMNDVCFLVHKRTEKGFDLMIKMNMNRRGKQERTNILSNKLYNN